MVRAAPGLRPHTTHEAQAFVWRERSMAESRKQRHNNLNFFACIVLNYHLEDGSFGYG